MKVLFISTMYPNSVIYLSGIFVHEQVKKLKNLGVDVKIIAPIPLAIFPFYLLNKRWNLYSKVPKMESLEGIDIYHPRYVSLPRGILKDFWGFTVVWSILRLLKIEKELHGVDVIHAHGSLPDDHAAQILASKLKSPYVVTVHGDTVYSTIHKRYFYRSKEALKNANAIIAVSTKVEERIKKYIGFKKNIFRVLNGYNATTCNEKKKKNTVTILFAATLIERKGCAYLLYAYSILLKEYQYIHLVIAGGGQQLSAMKKLAQELNIIHKVTFTGTLNHLMILQLMADSDIFILPSVNEAFGVVYLEAMSFKKPVIGTEGEGITDIIQDGVNGFLVKPKNVDSLVQKSKLLIESPKLRKEIGEKGYDSIKHLTWERNAEETIKIYEKILTHQRIN